MDVSCSLLGVTCRDVSQSALFLTVVVIYRFLDQMHFMHV